METKFKKHYLLRIVRIVRYGVKYLVTKEEKYKLEMQHNYYVKGFRK